MALPSGSKNTITRKASPQCRTQRPFLQFASESLSRRAVKPGPAAADGKPGKRRVPSQRCGCKLVRSNAFWNQSHSFCLLCCFFLWLFFSAFFSGFLLRGGGGGRGRGRGSSPFVGLMLLESKPLVLARILRHEPNHQKRSSRRS